MNIPTTNDWRSEPWGIDTPSAYNHFHGKTVAEAVRLFEDNAPVYQENLMFMPRRPFSFYIHAYIAYLLSDAAENDSSSDIFGRPFELSVRYFLKARPHRRR